MRRRAGGDVLALGVDGERGHGVVVVLDGARFGREVVCIEDLDEGVGARGEHVPAREREREVRHVRESGSADVRAQRGAGPVGMLATVAHAPAVGRVDERAAAFGVRLLDVDALGCHVLCDGVEARA